MTPFFKPTIVAVVALIIVACAATTSPLDATYNAQASIDAAIKAADAGINTGTLKGQTAVTTIKSLGVAKAAVQAAVAAQISASGVKP